MSVSVFQLREAATAAATLKQRRVAPVADNVDDDVDEAIETIKKIIIEQELDDEAIMI